MDGTILDPPAHMFKLCIIESRSDLKVNEMVGHR